MPVNLTFASKAYDDNNLFRYAYAYETISKKRTAPTLTPPLPTDDIPARTIISKSTAAPTLTATVTVQTPAGKPTLNITGTLSGEDHESTTLEVYVDGEAVQNIKRSGNSWEVITEVTAVWEGRPEEDGVPSHRNAMVVVLAVGANGRSAAKLLFAE